MQANLRKILGKAKIPTVTDVKAAASWGATAGIGALYFVQPWSFLRSMAFGEEES
eukprot:jgi/Pico_ML_1/54333/g4696.t1